MLGQSIIYGDHRELQLTLFGHRPQADDTCGSFFGTANNRVKQLLPALVNCANKVGAIVHRDVGLMVQGGPNVLVVGIVVLTLDGENRNLIVIDQSRSDIVLRAQRVAGAQDNIRSTSLQSPSQIGRLGRYV